MEPAWDGNNKRECTGGTVMADYKEKIRKLLSLAQSSNEHEAKEALLKAQELPIRHSEIPGRQALATS